MDDHDLRRTVRDRLESASGRRVERIAVVLAIVVVVAVGWMLKAGNQPARIAPPAESPPQSTATTAARGVIVHVAGAVRRPGVYELPEGARVGEAIEAAHGALRAADLGALNLAEALTDGAKVDVPRRGASVEAPVAGVTPSASPGPAAGVPVDVNTADQAALEAIPGIGPVKAAAILQHRSTSGAFTTVEQLLDVTGIGPATLEAIRPYVTV
jgi:competence protein ComEA